MAEESADRLRERFGVAVRAARGAVPIGIVGFLAASALAPLVPAVLGLGMGATVAVVVAQLGGMGGNYVAAVLMSTAERMRGREHTEADVRDALAEALAEGMVGRDEAAEGLRAEVGELLGRVDGVTQAVESAERLLRHELTAGFGALNRDLAEFGTVLDGLRRDVAVQSAASRHHTDLTKDVLSRLIALSRSIDPDDAPGAGPALDVPGVSPYPGMEPFDVTQARWFFGREEQTVQLLGRLAARLHRPGPVCVLGASGAGKSSLLRAGLLPALQAGAFRDERSAEWPWLLLTPGADPVGRLVDDLAARVRRPAGDVAAWLRAEPARIGLLVREALHLAAGDPDTVGSRRLMIVVDQFEELFTLCPNAEERLAFTRLLLAAAGDPADRLSPPALVVIGIRSDYLASCAELPGLTAAIADELVEVRALRAVQLRRAIELPATRSGVRVDDELVDALVGDLGSAGADGSYPAGRLPLLAYALRQMWDRRAGPVLTVHDYAAVGGISGAVERIAEQIHGQLDPAGRASLPRILLGMVTIGDDGQAGRRPVPREEVARIGDAAPAITDRLVAARLLTSHRGTIEISHEALLSAWPRLVGWIGQHRDALRLRRRLAEAAAQWSASDRDPDRLYRGRQLADAQVLFASGDRTVDLSGSEEAFLAASTAAGHRRVRLRRLAMAAVAGLLLVAAVAGTTAVQQRARVAEQAGVALSGRLAAEAEAARRINPHAAALLALGGWQAARTVETRSALLEVAADGYRGVMTGHSGLVRSVALTRDGRLAASAGYGDRTLRLWDTAEHRELATLHTDDEWGYVDVAFSPDDRLVAGAEISGVRLYDVATRQEYARVPGATSAIAFTPDGTTLAIGGYRDSIALWDVADRAVATTLPDNRQILDVAFGRDGTLLAAGADDGSITVWDVRTATPVATATVPGAVRALAFSPDGTMLAATAPSTSEVHRWRVMDDGGLADLTPLTSQSGAYQQLAFHPQGRLLVAAAARNVQSWQPDEENPRSAVFTGHPTGVNSVAVSGDGRTLVSGDVAGSLHLWTVGYHSLFGHDGAVTTVAAQPTGTLFATGGSDATIRLWDAATRSPVHTLRGHTERVYSVRFSPDGSLLASAGQDGTVRLWDPATGRELHSFRLDRPARFEGLGFSRDGTMLAAAALFPDPDGPSGGGAVFVWDVATRHELRRVDTPADSAEGSSPWPTAVDFSDTGSIAVAMSEGDLMLFDPRTQDLPVTWRGHPASDGPNAQAIDVAFSPDGAVLASAGADRTVRLWDARTHRALGVIGHNAVVRAVAFSPDGRAIATASHDNVARLWDAGNLQPVARLTGHFDELNDIAFTADGRGLLTASADDTAAVWPADPDQARRDICAILAGRPLPDQWAELGAGLGGPPSC